MPKTEQPAVTSCSICHRPFTLGDTVYFLRLGVHQYDLCFTCKEKVENFLQTLLA